MSKKLIGGITLLVLIVGALTLTLTWSTTSEQEGRVTIAIANLQEHPILDAVESGVRDELARQGYEEGEGVRYIMRNANGDMQRVGAIASDLASQNPDVIVAISTPVAQAVTRLATAPVVFGALTDPVQAGVLESMDSTKPKITGTTDALPYSEQLRLIRRISPQVERLGMLFNPGEASSQHAIREVRREAPGLGFELVEGAVNSTNEVSPVAQNLAGRVDALLISTDNTVAAGIAGAVRVASDRAIPLYAFDSGSVERGAIAAVSAGYYDIGLKTGELAARMLEGERNIQVVRPEGGEIYLNQRAAERMGVEIPEDVQEEATKVYTDIQG